MRKVLVLIQYEVEPAKREAYLAYAREMREHAVDVLGLAYDIFEDLAHPGSFCETFTCASTEDYEALDDKQDDRFREFVSRLDRFADLEKVRYSALGHRSPIAFETQHAKALIAA